MNRWLVLFTICAGTILAVISYNGVNDYAELGIDSSAYAPIAGAEPAFEPRIIEPLLDPPDLKYPWKYPYGYENAEYVPEDGSVILTFEDSRKNGTIHVPGSYRMVFEFDALNGQSTGATHSQTYSPGQTFAYRCINHDGGTEMHMYQYRGVSTFQEVRSLVLAYFVVDIPESLPCIFPDYLEHTVDVYDAGAFDGLQDYGSADYDHALYADSVRRAVIVTPMYVDVYPLRQDLDHALSLGPHVEDVMLLADGSIDVTFLGAGPDSARSHNYEPGQTFAANCTEYEGITFLRLYDYKGTAEFGGSEKMVFLNFGAHTRSPMPCEYPGFITQSVDAFDTSWFDGQYDAEVRRLASLEGLW